MKRALMITKKVDNVEYAFTVDISNMSKVSTYEMYDKTKIEEILLTFTNNEDIDLLIEALTELKTK